MTIKKKYTIRNAIMFAMVMRDKELCVDLLNKIFPERKIVDIRYIQEDEAEANGKEPKIENTIYPAIESKAVRLDVLFETDDSWNDIELQVADEPDLPKRCRYYHSAMDVAQLKPGKSYGDLKASYVIFICCSDYFGLDEPTYFFEPVDKKLSLRLEDKSYTMILNTSCSAEKIPDELKDLFEYINTGKLGNIKDDFVKRMDKFVQDYNKNQEVQTMMTLEEEYKIRMDYIMKEHKKTVEALNAEMLEEKLETAKHLKQEGISVEIIARSTGLSEKDIEAL